MLPPVAFIKHFILTPSTLFSPDVITQHSEQHSILGITFSSNISTLPTIERTLLPHRELKPLIILTPPSLQLWLTSTSISLPNQVADPRELYFLSRSIFSPSLLPYWLPGFSSATGGLSACLNGSTLGDCLPFPYGE